MGSLSFLKPEAEQDLQKGIPLAQIRQKYGPGTMDLSLDDNDLAKMGVTPEQASAPGWMPDLDAVQGALAKGPAAPEASAAQGAPAAAPPQEPGFFLDGLSQRLGISDSQIECSTPSS